MDGTALEERQLLLYSGLCLYVAINTAKFAGMCGVGLLLFLLASKRTQARTIRKAFLMESNV